MSKTCKACGEEKPVTEFHKDKSRPDGLNFHCKVCHKRRQAEIALTKPGRYPAVDGQKKCSRCKATKAVDEFNKSTRTFDGLDKRCKQCGSELHSEWRLKNLSRGATYMRDYRAKNIERMRDISRKQHYGVAPGWYAATLAAQDGKCASCGTTAAGGLGTFHVDHCHDSGKVRSLLCHHCNLAIGHLRNDPEIAEAVKQYLIKHK